MKSDRLFKIIYILLDKKAITAKELAKELEVSVRTVYRDVETLSISGIPIFTTQGKNGGVALMDGYTFDKSLLSKEDIDNLIFAAQSLKTYSADAGDLISKLGTSFSQNNTDWINVDFSRWGFKKEDTELFKLLKTAVLSDTAIEITYCNSCGSKKARVIEPIKLIYKEKNWYLQAFCRCANDFRLFKLTRIVSAKATEQKFIPYNNKNVPKIEQETSEAIVSEISLRFPPQQAYRVYDEFDSKSIIEEPNGYFSVKVRFPIDNWVTGYLLSFGTDIEILEPASLRREVSDYAKKISEHHKTKS